MIGQKRSLRRGGLGTWGTWASLILDTYGRSLSAELRAAVSGKADVVRVRCPAMNNRATEKDIGNFPLHLGGAIMSLIVPMLRILICSAGQLSNPTASIAAAAVGQHLVEKGSASEGTLFKSAADHANV